jgi:hypothetical protein
MRGPSHLATRDMTPEQRVEWWRALAGNGGGRPRKSPPPMPEHEVRKERWDELRRALRKGEWGTQEEEG